jgi:hypothetical protein
MTPLFRELTNENMQGQSIFFTKTSEALED